MTPTQKWIIGIILAISMSVSGYMVGRIDLVNKDLQDYKIVAAKEALAFSKDQVTFSKDYVLKDDYKCAIDDLKKQLSKMDDKLDNLIKRSK